MRVEAVPVIAVLNKLQGPESSLSVRVARRRKETSQTKCVQYATDAVVVGAYARLLRGGGVRVEALAVFHWVLCGLGRCRGQPELPRRVLVHSDIIEYTA